MCLGRTVSTDDTNTKTLSTAASRSNYKTELDRLKCKASESTNINWVQLDDFRRCTYQTYVQTCNPTYRHVIIRKDILQERQAHHRPQNDSSVIWQGALTRHFNHFTHVRFIAARNDKIRSEIKDYIIPCRSFLSLYIQYIYRGVKNPGVSVCFHMLDIMYTRLYYYHGT
jgi:hypothetical protein